MRSIILKSTYVLTIACVFLAMAATGMTQKSLTCDEASHHIASGYVFLTKGDFAFSTEAPPLPRYIVAAPLLFMDINMPADRAFWAREDRGEFSREFLYSLNRSKVEIISLLSRSMNLIVGLFGGLFLFAWAAKRYGTPEAVIASLFYFLSPEIIAHASLATTDMAAAVFIMCSVLTFWDLLEKPVSKRALVAGLFLGLALMSKFSALLLLFFYALSVFAALIFRAFSYKWGEAFRTIVYFLLCVISSVVILWAGYGFETKPILKGVLRAEEKAELFENAARRFLPSAGDDVIKKMKEGLYTQPVPLSSFLVGAAGILKHGEEGSQVFFMGKWSEKGHPLYYFAAILIKTPLPLLLCLLVGIFNALGWGSNRVLNIYLLAAAGAFIAAASHSNLQLGIRYILPAWPFLFIIAALGVRFLLVGGIARKTAAYFFLFWFCAESFFIWPDHLSYFNELAGGPANGYRYLRDSNIDWGQDLPALKWYMDRKGIDEVTLYYFGSADPAYHGIKYHPFTDAEFGAPKGKVYAVSVQYLDAVEWAKDRKPTARAGYSIFVYDMRE